LKITVVELREQLIHANVTFATEIVDIQENLNEGLNKLVDIIAEVEELPYTPSDYYTMSLIPPIVLILQLIEMTLSSVSNIMGTFQAGAIPFDPYYFLEKYVPHVDWVDFKKASEEYLRIMKIKTEMSGEGTNPAAGQSQSGY